MRLIADLHIHSRFSRATSPEMNLDSLAKWARIKGIDVIGTGDFTHPAHFKDIETLLKPGPNGLFVLKDDDKASRPVYFMLTAEVSNIYTQDSKTRKIHNLIFAPGLDAARKITTEFARRGNVTSDGRPIFGFSAIELIKIVLEADERAMLVPAHAWTPWFSIFGSKSGFDSIEECFKEYAPYVRAIETGLSSDPEMNRRVSGLDDITLISNSDAHSPSKLGREANVFDCEADYDEITRIIKEKDAKRFLYTIEFFPEEGKYHSDGHRACGVISTPEETVEAGGRCPVCGGAMTIGVLSRVNALGDRAGMVGPPTAIPCRKAVPLEEIIAETLGVGAQSKKVKKTYEELTSGASEFQILLDLTNDELDSLCKHNLKIAEAILKVRRGEISITPGYDGEFGKISIWGATEKPVPRGPRQMRLK